MHHITKFLIIFLFFFQAAISDVANACNCIRRSEVENQKRADAVFTAKVIEKRQFAHSNIRVRLKLIQPMKISKSAELFFSKIQNDPEKESILLLQEMGKCSFLFEYDKTYKIFVNIKRSVKGQPYLNAHLCSGTREKKKRYKKIKAKKITKIICQKKGGTWAKRGLLKKYECNLPTEDGGKKCYTHSDCTSMCITSNEIPTGTKSYGKCFNKTLTRGMCFNFIQNGRATGVICED